MDDSAGQDYSSAVCWNPIHEISLQPHFLRQDLQEWPRKATLRLSSMEQEFVLAKILPQAELGPI